MAGQPSLVAAVQAFTALPAGTSYAAMMTAAQAVMLEWAGATDVSATSRGTAFDGRKLAFLERYLGDAMTFKMGAGHSSDPGNLAGAILNQSWTDLQLGVAARLLVQTSPVLSQSFVYSATLDAILPIHGVVAALIELGRHLGALTPASLDGWREAALVINGMGQDLHVDTQSLTALVGQILTPNVAALVNAAADSLDLPAVLANYAEARSRRLLAEQAVFERLSAAGIADLGAGDD